MQIPKPVHAQDDVKIATFAAGFTIGFGFLTVWEVIKQTRRARNRMRCVYIWMLWGEVIANMIIGTQAIMFIYGFWEMNLPFLLICVTSWTFELQLLMQIIINRLTIVMFDRRKARKLKWWTAGIMTFINVSVYVIWIPAMLNVNNKFVAINQVWDKIGKVIVCAIDAGLNAYFIKVVKQKLVNEGNTKYNALVTFNIRIIMVSVLMDVLVLALMSLRNGAVYLQFHPVAYMVKLNIEMSMATLILKITKGQSGRSYELTAEPTDDVDNSSPKPHFAPSDLESDTRAHSRKKGPGTNTLELSRLASGIDESASTYGVSRSRSLNLGLPSKKADCNSHLSNQNPNTGGTETQEVHIQKDLVIETALYTLPGQLTSPSNTYHPGTNPPATAANNRDRYRESFHSLTHQPSNETDTGQFGGGNSKKSDCEEGGSGRCSEDRPLRPIMPT